MKLPKTKMWILIALSVAVVLGLAASMLRSGGIETPTYELLATYGKVEVRRYPKMLVAKTTTSDNSFDRSGSNGFRTVANYIFGGNERKQKIAMTAPVVMNLGDTASMYFVMPKEYGKDDLPKPNSPNVEVTEVGSKVLAVLRFKDLDEAVEIAVRLGIDAKKSDQVVRGAVVLPNGTGKTKRVVVAGCLVQRHRAKMLEWAPGIDAMIGVFDRDHIVDAVAGEKAADLLLGSRS